MINLQPKNKRELLAVAMGKKPAEICLTNLNLVNVITGEIYPADVYIHEGFIAHVESDEVGKNILADKIIDLNGDYLIPGLVDSHIHIESSMLTPRNFAKAVVNHGTTTVITDPHELANVFGVDAVKYMHEASEDIPMRQLIDIPSCVPAVPGLENAGAEFFAKEINELAKLERVVGLAEVMDFLGVVNGEDRMMDIIDAAKQNGLYLQGHIPFVSSRILSAYAIGGARTCHESRAEKDFIEKMRKGIAVDARESSISHDAKAGVNATKNIKFFDFFSVCTDDREADDILHEGHLNLVVKSLVSYGMDILTAIKCATINNARHAKIENLGAIAPGYIADMLVLPSLEEMKPRMVFFEGNLVSENGKLIKEIEKKEYAIEKRNSMNVKDISESLLTFKAPIQNGIQKVNVMTYQDLGLSLTTAVTEELPVTDGVLDISGDKSLKYVAVINRYGKGTIGLGIVRNFGTDKGAVASTVSHDSHNLTVVYDTPENAYIAVKALIDCGGGMSAAADGKLIATLELKLGGLMSLKPAEEVAEDSKVMKKALHSLGLIAMNNPLLRIVTLALPVIPDVKMSDLGLVDVNNKVLIPLYV